jgi:alkylation response protein AidB-like acyl-CoA dehydrogenase
MDVRLTAEQAQLRDAAAKLAADLGPASVADLADAGRAERLERALDATGWRSLRGDGASGVEVAIVAEELARGLVDVPFLGPVLADDLLRHLPGEGGGTIVVGDTAPDTRAGWRGVALEDGRVLAGALDEPTTGVDPTRRVAGLSGPLEPLGEPGAQACGRWQVLALVTTTADLLGAARGAHALACEYAKVREQYGATIGSYQAVAHLLAEGLALIEGSVSVLRYAAWAVDELPAAEALRAARIAKLYCARAARTVCETAIQVHGGIGNTWECLAHVYLRRALRSTELFGVRLEEILWGMAGGGACGVDGVGEHSGLS